MNDRERRVREQRLIEASRKNLIGMEGKIGTILRNLGQPIWKDGSDWFTSNEFDSPNDWVWEEGDEIPTADIDASSSEIGMVFDALSWGIHVEIRYLTEEQKLTLLYQDTTVYEEISGDLECYVPGDWEQKI